MSDKGGVLERSAEWAHAEKQFSRNGKIHILNKYNMNSSLLEEVGRLYSDVSESTLRSFKPAHMSTV